MPGKPVKNSPIWNYFSYPGSGKFATCLVIKKPYSLGSEISRNYSNNSQRTVRRQFPNEMWNMFEVRKFLQYTMLSGA